MITPITNEKKVKIVPKIKISSSSNPNSLFRRKFNQVTLSDVIILMKLSKMSPFIP